jgi:hypothetical protein
MLRKTKTFAEAFLKRFYGAGCAPRARFAAQPQRRDDSPAVAVDNLRGLCGDQRRNVTRPDVTCPCGISRQDCDYHRDVQLASEKDEPPPTLRSPQPQVPSGWGFLKTEFFVAGVRMTPAGTIVDLAKSIGGVVVMRASIGRLTRPDRRPLSFAVVGHPVRMT